MFRNIKKELLKLLKDVSTNISFEIASEKKLFPHIVLNLVNDVVAQGLHILTLDVDIWDRNNSTKNVDDLVDKVIKKLNRIHVITDDIHMVLYLTNILTVSDSDSTIKRKTCIFELQVRNKNN